MVRMACPIWAEDKPAIMRRPAIVAGEVATAQTHRLPCHLTVLRRLGQLLSTGGSRRPERTASRPHLGKVAAAEPVAIARDTAAAADAVGAEETALPRAK